MEKSTLQDNLTGIRGGKKKRTVAFK